MKKAYPQVKDWSPEDLALLVQSEVLAISDPVASYQVGEQLKAKADLWVIYYHKFANRWQCSGPITYAKFRQLTTDELKQMHGKRQFGHSKYAFHPPNYETLEEFDRFMIAQYGGTIPPIDPADMNDDLLKIFDNL